MGRFRLLRAPDRGAFKPRRSGRQGAELGRWRTGSCASFWRDSFASGVGGNRRKIAAAWGPLSYRTHGQISGAERRAGDNVFFRPQRQRAGNQGVRQRRNGVREMIRPQVIAMTLGTASVLLLLGALGFQYLGHLPPCELCMWQRWPHAAAAVVGLAGPLLILFGLAERSTAWSIAALTALLIAVSGAVGAYHAGIEWHWWPGP